MTWLIIVGDVDYVTNSLFSEEFRVLDSTQQDGVVRMGGPG